MDFLWYYLIVGLIFNGLLSLVGAYVASEKGRSGPAFWLLGFLLSFLIALLVAIGIPKIEKGSNLPGQRYSHKRCPDCAEQILIEATKCKHCGAKQPARKTSPSDVRSWCPSCRSESTIPPHSACPNCGEETHPWE
jgi:predicted RNA-binding Zn-ribbon protein involved in translation (DUF1610 family)